MSDVEGVILAAGLSTRAGCFKMEWRLGDRTLIEWAVAGMSPAVDRIVVVGGFQVERLRAILDGAPKVEVVYNERLRGRHVQLGEGGAASRAGGPLLPAAGRSSPGQERKSTGRCLARPGTSSFRFSRGARGIRCSMSARLIDPILQAPDSATLRDITQRYGYETVEIADEGIVLDVDDPDSYQTVRRAYEHDDQ